VTPLFTTWAPRPAAIKKGYSNLFSNISATYVGSWDSRTRDSRLLLDFARLRLCIEEDKSLSSTSWRLEIEGLLDVLEKLDLL